MCSAPDKNPLNTPVAIFGQMLECGFIKIDYRRI